MWRNLVLYDGECGLCDRLVQWLLRHDKKGVLSYAPLQGETAKPFVIEAGKPLGTASGQPTRLAPLGSPSGGLDTMVFVERGDDGAARVFVRSRGVFRILSKLGGIWRVLSWGRVFPAILTDLGYRFVARHRIRWFGRVETCRVPDASTRARFFA